jgi:hypothetical protein
LAHSGAAVLDDHGIQYGNHADGRAVHQPAKEEQQWSDPFGSLKNRGIFEYPTGSPENQADFRISKRMFGEPDRFSNIRKDFRRTGWMFEYPKGFPESRPDFRISEKISEEPAGFSDI